MQGFVFFCSLSFICGSTFHVYKTKKCPSLLFFGHTPLFNIRKSWKADSLIDLI